MKRKEQVWKMAAVEIVAKIRVECEKAKSRNRSEIGVKRVGVE